MPPKITNFKMPSINHKKGGLSQSMHNPQAGDGSHPWPKHFILREGSPDGTPGAIVPLIPVDLLPEYVDILSVPRNMTIEETTGMSNLGTFSKPEGHFQLHFSPQPHAGRDGPAVLTTLGDYDEHMHLGKTCPPREPKHELARPPEVAMWASNCLGGKPQPAPPWPTPAPPRVLDWAEDTETVSTDNFSVAEISPPDSSTSSSASNYKREQSQKQQQHQQQRPATEIADRMLKLGYAMPAQIAAHSKNTKAPAPASTPAQSNSSGTGGSKKPAKAGKQKVARPAGSLCRYWCHTGQCSWGNECRYTHQMPVTLEGLADVGLTGLPAWWRKAAGLPTEGTIDMRIFAGAVTAASASGSSGSMNYSSPALPLGATSTIPIYPSKKARLKAEMEERKMAEEVHSVRLRFERAQAAASPTVEVGSKRRPGSGQTQMQVLKVQQHEKVEKLVDI
ncbi:hypothetical protein EsH8_VI_000538 [Colletotrichum jinshuiense]